MKYAVLSLSLVASMSAAAFGQTTWNVVNTNDLQSAYSGFVGIGVAPTAGKLHVYSGSTIGVYAQTNSTGTAAIYADIANSSNAASAFFGSTASANGGGVLGYSANTTGAGYGVWGDTFASAGYGVVGRARTASGTGVGVYGSTASSTGFAFYGVGGKNYFDGNTGIGTSSPATKLHVTGSVRFDSVSSHTTGASTPLVVNSSGDVMKQTLSTGFKEFRSTGTQSAWTVPDGVYRVHIKMWGAGGGGTSGSGAAGGSGGYIEGWLLINGGSSLTFTVGAGGTPGNAGGSTSFSFNSYTFTAGGGAANGGAGGTAAITGSSPSPYADFITSSGFTGVAGASAVTPPPYPAPADSGNTVYIPVGSGASSVYTRGSNGAVVIDW